MTRQELREKLLTKIVYAMNDWTKQGPPDEIACKATDQILHFIDEYVEYERKEAYEAGYQQGRVDEESKRHAEPNPQADNTKPETESRRAGIGGDKNG